MLNVWKSFNCKTFGDYHDIYLKTNITHLDDVFQTFWKPCMNTYKLDIYIYIITLHQVYLGRFTKIELELLTDIDMYLFIEKGMRGGLSMVSKRHTNRMTLLSLIRFLLKNAITWCILMQTTYTVEQDHYHIVFQWGWYKSPNKKTTVK